MGEMDATLSTTYREKEKLSLEVSTLRIQTKSLEEEVAIVSSLKTQLTELRSALDFLENENKLNNQVYIKSEEVTVSRQQAENFKNKYKNKEKKQSEKLLSLCEE